MNLYHYCSNAVLIAIISNKEIWASQLSLSNDALEGKWVKEVFSSYCQEKGVEIATQAELLRHLDFLAELSAYAGFCMSEDGDLLSQWRAYADNGAGVSIGFNSEYFERLGNLKRDRGDEFSAHLTKIEYDVAKQKELIAEHIDEILKLVADGALRRPTLLSSEEDTKKWKEKFMSMGLRFIFFYFFIYRLKNPAFAEEREWRVISHVFRNNREDSFGQIGMMDFRSLSDRIVPFARIALEPLQHVSVTEVVLGPRNTTPAHVVEALLHKHGWTDVLVRRSAASYR